MTNQMCIDTSELTDAIPIKILRVGNAQGPNNRYTNCVCFRVHSYEWTRFYLCLTYKIDGFFLYFLAKCYRLCPKIGFRKLKHTNIRVDRAHGTIITAQKCCAPPPSPDGVNSPRGAVWRLKSYTLQTWPIALYDPAKRRQKLQSRAAEPWLKTFQPTVESFWPKILIVWP